MAKALGRHSDKNVHFLKEVNRKYDPQGLFQQARVGGFKRDFSSATEMRL